MPLPRGDFLGFAVTTRRSELNLAGTVWSVGGIHVGVDWTGLHEVDRDGFRPEFTRQSLRESR
jgi:hypothetical protein